MYKYPKGLYCDVRIENIAKCDIYYKLGELESYSRENDIGALIRIFDGEKWYYNITTDINGIQNEIDYLSKYAKANKDINKHPVVKKFQVNKDKLIKYSKKSITKIDKQEKFDLMKEFFPVLKKNKNVRFWTMSYIERHTEKKFYSSRGSDIVFDRQIGGFSVNFNLNIDGKLFAERFVKASDNFSELKGYKKEVAEFLKKCEDFTLNATPIKPGIYPIVLSPIAAGVFAHESFGHKSEADFMIGDETMKKEWQIGKKVGSKILSIVDDGNEKRTGYTPYDDDGTKSEKTYLIKSGVLSGRLHSAYTAALLGEGLTGNSRAINFEFEPIVRMTNTYIEAGDQTFEQMIKGIKKGIYIESIKHGSGLSIFTIAPSMSYMIENGKVTKPVNVSVISGSVFETLNHITGLTKKVELQSFVGGGCGKGEQWPLPVGFGGPFVLVDKMNVQ